jgi:hypothetical protein
MSSHNIALSEPTAGPGLGGISKRLKVKRLLWLPATLLVLAALLAPAEWNGFPLIFADTGGYVLRPFAGTLEYGRSALYGAFLAAGIRLEFWPNVLLQAALALWIIALTLRTHLRGLTLAMLLLAIIALVVATSLPWTASQLIPDVFVLLAALALHLLAFQPQALTRAEIAGLVAVTAFAIASHMSILAMTLSLLAAYGLVRLFAHRFAFPIPHLALPLLAVAAGIGLALTSNAMIGGQFAFTPGGPNFLFARLLQDGIVQRHLDRACPDYSMRICDYRDELPTATEDWLWLPDSPFYKMGGWQDFTPEAQRIILATLRTEPGANVLAAARDTLAQLVAVGTGDGISPENNQHAEWALSEVAPKAMPHFRAAPQQNAQFDFTAINVVQLPLALLASAAAPIIFLLWRRRQPGISALALSATLALVANAAICGIFSSTNARYQSRLVPIATLTVLIAGIDGGRRILRPAISSDVAKPPTSLA